MDICVGIDEVGRGPLAGPVVAAAVILNPARPIQGLNDSKILTALKREKLFAEIKEHALAVGIGMSTVEEIDQLNILQASLLAMKRAVKQLHITPTLALIDGNQAPSLPFRTRTIVGGDATEPCISAASIIAKVTRDAIMVQAELEYPGYGFAQHKGYGTEQHQISLRTLGPCDLHRRSFAPVRLALVSRE